MCVFGNRWINKVETWVFVLRFFFFSFVVVFFFMVGDAARPGGHVGSRCHDVTNEILRYKLLAHPLIGKKKKKLETKIPKQLQVGFDALMYMCLIKK